MVMSVRYLLDIEKKKLLATAQLEDSINRVFRDAIMSTNIDGTVVDECYEKFGDSLAIYAVSFLRNVFFDAVMDKNASFVSELRKEITALTDVIISQIEEGNTNQIEESVNNIVGYASDRRIYGNLDNFLIVNIDSALNIMRSNKNFPLDEDNVSRMLSNIKSMVQNFILIILDGNKKAVDTAITNYVNEIIKIVKDAQDINKLLDDTVDASETYGNKTQDFISDSSALSVFNSFGKNFESTGESVFPKM